VLTRLQEQYRRADERRQKSGRVQCPGLLELGGEDPDQYQQDDRLRGEVQQVDGHPRDALVTDGVARVHEGQHEHVGPGHDRQEPAPSDERQEMRVVSPRSTPDVVALSMADSFLLITD
jgi:hypothetical protein